MVLPEMRRTHRLDRPVCAAVFASVLSEMMHHRAKLTAAQVAAIRREYLAYVRGYGYLARKYGCGESTVRDIVQYRTRPA